MKKIIGAALLASTAMAGVASAETSASVAMTSNYVWRGLTQSDSNFAVQGSFDVTQEQFYAGAWASSVDFGGAAGSELDLYAGFRPTVGAFSLDFGVLGYFYPGSTDAGGDLDFWELKAAGSINPTDPLTLGAAVYWTDDFGTADQQGLYLEANGRYDFSDMFAVSAAYGNQDVDLAGDYSTWNLGGTVALHGFAIDLRYHDTDISGADEEYSLSISRAL